MILEIQDCAPNSSAAFLLTSGSVPYSMTFFSNSAEKGIIGPPPCSFIQALILGNHLFFLILNSSSPMLTKYTIGLAVNNE